MTRYGMVIDVDRCIGCYNCFLACRDEHAGNDHRPVAAAQPEAGQKWIDVREHERGSFPKVKVSYVPVPCLHCADAPCISAATDGAVYRRADGIVLIDPDKAVGQRDIVDVLSLRRDLLERGAEPARRNAPSVRPSARRRLEGAALRRGLPDAGLVFGDGTVPRSEISKLHATRVGRAAASGVWH